MASPRGEYTPKSGPLKGQTFTSYYRYQDTRAKSILGFHGGYTQERKAKETPKYREWLRIAEEKKGGRLNATERTGYQQTFASAYNNQFKDKSARGPLARVLTYVGLRDPKWDFPVGESDKHR